jgi:hypothetical protein
MKKLFVIPQKTQSIIATIENDKIVNLGIIDIPYHSKTIYCEKHGIFVSINFNENALKIYRENGEFLGFNNQFNFSSIAIKDDVVYLGGAYKKKKNGLGELCSLLDLNEVDFKFKQINLPIVAVKNKAIDDIVVIGNKLILLDNIVFPKYIFEFDIANPRNPVYTTTINLPDNGTYEHIVKGDGNEKWLGIKSSTVGSSGTGQHLNFLGEKKISMNYLNHFPKYGVVIENDETPFVNNENTFDFGFLNEKIIEYLSKPQDERKELLKGENCDMFEYIQEMIDCNNILTFSKPIIDFCIIDDNVWILQKNALYCYDLTIFPDKNIKKVTTQLTDMSKLIKTVNNRIVVVSAENYELISLN